MDLKDKFFAEYLKSLTPEQWVDLLGADTTFWEYCSDREKFNSRDWRKLVQYDYEFFADKCEWQKLDAEDWFLLLIDVLTNYTPFVLVKRIYALAALAGSSVYYLLHIYGEFININDGLALIIGLSVTFILRILAMTFKWNMPIAIK